MKRNLLSSAIIVAIMALGLTGCDDKKAETETPPPANSQPAAPAPEAPVAKAEAKPETPAQPVVDEQAVFDEKMDVYIKCYNKLQIPVQRSLARYVDWLKGGLPVKSVLFMASTALVNPTSLSVKKA